MALRRISILAERIQHTTNTTLNTENATLKAENATFNSENVSLRTRKNIDIFVEQGLVKHILRWLTVSFMYSLSFVDFIPSEGKSSGEGGKEMRNLQLPQETLRALSSLCR